MNTTSSQIYQKRHLINLDFNYYILKSVLSVTSSDFEAREIVSRSLVTKNGSRYTTPNVVALELTTISQFYSYVTSSDFEVREIVSRSFVTQMILNTKFQKKEFH